MSIEEIVDAITRRLNYNSEKRSTIDALERAATADTVSVPPNVVIEHHRRKSSGQSIKNYQTIPPPVKAISSLKTTKLKKK